MSTAALVVLSAFALSSPVYAGVVKSNIDAHARVTAALCTGLKYSLPGVNPLYDACVDAKLIAAASSTVATRALAQTGVTAALCAGLNLNLLGSSQLQAACLAAGLAVTADATTKAVVKVLTPSGDIPANPYSNAMNSCNTLSTQLNGVLGGITTMASSKVNSLSTDVIVPTLIKISGNLNAAAAATTNYAACTDATVEAYVVQSWNAFSTNLECLLSSISQSLNVLIASSAQIKASLHATVTELRSTLVAYTNQLDRYVVADVARSSIQATLLLRLDTCIHATV